MRGGVKRGSERQGGVTDQELSEIEARANAATEGPWRAEYANITSADVVGPLDADLVQRKYGGRAQYLVADAEFIAAARTDIPALVAEVRALRKQVEMTADGYGMMHKLAQGAERDAKKWHTLYMAEIAKTP